MMKRMLFLVSYISLLLFSETFIPTVCADNHTFTTKIHIRTVDEKGKVDLTETFRDLHIVDKKTIIVVGDNDCVNITKDEGKNWKSRQFPSFPWLKSIYCIDSKVGWIVGMFGIILKTKSSFESWEFVPTSINNNLHTCFFFDQVTGVVAGPVGIIMEIPNGNGLSEMFDKNPRVDFEHLDCVTIIEKSLGLTIWNHRSNYIDILYKIRYKGGQVSNQTRNHFFIQDWIPSNSWLVEDITTNIGGEDVKNLTKTIRRNTLHPLEKMDIPIKDMRYHTYYIPLSAVKKILQHVIHPMIIVFFGNHHWIFASHVVMIIPTLKVEKFLRHTSSYQKIVVDLPFLSYLTKAKNIIGIKFLDIN